MLGFAPNRTPDIQWALNALSTLLPTHRIFGKGYVREPPPLIAVSRPVIDNSDGLFDGLPLRKGKPAKRSILKKNRPNTEARMQRLLTRRARIEMQVARLQGNPANPVNANASATTINSSAPNASSQPQNASFVA